MVFGTLSKFSRRQLLTLVVFSIADFCNAICVSLQAPFYPKEAELKGATATEYGLVFGVFELVVFLISPVYGQHLNRIGPKYLFNAGIFTTGICAILFGLLDRIQGHYPFILLSFIIRIIEAMGNAAFLTASFAIIAKEFPDNIATTFASLETFFGLGLIVGPTVGGALYEAGGYTTPFAVLGFTLFLSAVMTAFVLPEHCDPELDSKHGASLSQVLRIPGVLLAACSIVVTSMSIGFLNAVLEPHMRQFHLSPMLLGLMFVINGGTYAMTAPCWGWLCDSKVTPKIITIVGCILLVAGFSLIGPAPFIPTGTILWITILGLVLHGLGIAALLVSSFTDALRTAIQYGFPNNLETYGLISGLWTSTFALGAFIGPSIAGILYDAWDFRVASMFIVLLTIIVAIAVKCCMNIDNEPEHEGVIVVVFLICTKPKKLYKEVGRSSDHLLAVPPTTNAGRKYSNSITSECGSSTSTTNGGWAIGGSSASLPCERPPGMSGIIASNSYRNRHGNWHRRDSSAIDAQSTSYSHVDSSTRLLSP